MELPGGVKLKTLIVEDNATYRGLLKESLESLFPAMAIQEAMEGKEALQRVESFRPELVFMDIRLPGENGLQLTHRIKTSYPDTKVIILTSYDTVEYRQAAAQCGASSFMAKDALNFGQVETLVNSVLSGPNKPL